MGPEQCDEILLLRVLDGKNGGVLHVLMDQKASTTALQRAIYKNLQNSVRRAILTCFSPATVCCLSSPCIWN